VEEVNIKNIDYDISNIREIEEIYENIIFLSLIQLKIILFVSQYYIVPIHHALALFFPRNLKEKIQKQTVHKIKPSIFSYKIANIQLSLEQESIYKKIQDTTQNKHLIYGVTWSGKTQIYMKIIEENLKSWRQTLLLIPEIILTSQIGERVIEVFWKDVIILHSGVSPAKKSQYWMDIYSWNAKIVIGTRSSLFYPYNNLWAIIIDEEHDESYISDAAPRYHTLDVAEKISELSEIPLILGSWTPRVSTFYRALQWEFQLLQLLEKFK